MGKTFVSRILAAAVCAMAVLSSCEVHHFITDTAYRKQVEDDLRSRMEEISLLTLDIDYGNRSITCNYGYVKDCYLTTAELEALEFLYAYMPLADLTGYPADYFLQNVRASFKAREEMGWNVPERIFRHFVLPIRVNNENLDTSRVAFYSELKPRLEGLQMQDAILEVNHWCHEKLTYRPSDARTLSPLSCARSTFGRCGEEATFTVAALRAVGIPARQVYTPRWAHTDDNHAWVEAWADGNWYFMGACEPEPVLNLGWFNAPASRAMLMHTRVFGKYDGPEEKVMEGSNFTEINLIDNYAETARVDFEVVDEAGNPVDGALVDFMIYNYAEFYPALSKYTLPDGKTFLTAGKGDMLCWASKDGKYGYSKVSFGTDKEVRIIISDGHPSEPQALAIVPPPEKAVLPSSVSSEMQKIIEANEDNVYLQYGLGIGSGTPSYYADLTGSVNKILFEEYEVNTKYESVQAGVSSNHGGVKESTEFITVHYTGNMSKTADGNANAQYFATGGGNTSIHYVTGNDGIYHILDNSLVGFHAGDGTGTRFKWIPTGVMYQAGDPQYPVWGISSDSYFMINGKKTTYPVPTGDTQQTKKVTDPYWINDMGLSFKVVDGEYYMGTTYWCYNQVSEGRICNHGGNNNSVGIESCVNQGSDLWYTWQLTAQLVAHLMIDFDLDITRVVGHHFYSAKNCPQPMLENDLQLWWYFIELVKAEYEVLTTLANYDISFEILSGSTVRENGRVRQPKYSECIQYKVVLTNKTTSQTEEIVLASVVNGSFTK